MGLSLHIGDYIVVSGRSARADVVWGPLEHFSDAHTCVRYGKDQLDIGAVFDTDGLAYWLADDGSLHRDPACDVLTKL
jgi:hypothetical protein